MSSTPQPIDTLVPMVCSRSRASLVEMRLRPEARFTKPSEIAEAFNERLERSMYPGGRPNRVGRALNRAWALVGSAGLWPNRLVTLEVRGRRSGRTISFPLVVADVEGKRYLVAMLGERARWVQNVRAVNGRVILRHGRRETVHLEEVDPAERPPILRRYVKVAPGGRAMIGVQPDAPQSEFERIAPDYPVFRIAPDPGASAVHRKSLGARLLGRSARVPSVLDRRGTRWLLQALGPAQIIVLVHRGRKSGNIFKTPVEVMVDDRERDELIVAPLWGKDSDWYRNVIAGGLVEVHVRSEKRKVEWRELDEAERRAAMEAYRDAHPIYSRLILRMVVRVNQLQGDPERAVACEVPMLGLRRIGSA